MLNCNDTMAVSAICIIVTITCLLEASSLLATANSDVEVPAASYHRIVVNDKATSSNQSHRLSHRERRDVDLNAASLSLNTLGIVTSIFYPGIGALPLLLGAIVSYIDGARTTVSDEIITSRQKQDLNGIRDHIDELKSQNLTNPTEASQGLKQLCNYLSLRRCTFMHGDHVNADNFIAFATTHMATNELRKSIHPDDQHYLDIGKEHIRNYIRYARFALQKVLGNHELSAVSTSVTRLRASIATWTTLLPSDEQQRLRNENAIPDMSRVSFKAAETKDNVGWFRHAWLSCWDTYSYCDLRSCPGENNVNPNQCHGERFKIYSLDPTDPNGFIRSCSRFGIYYTYYRSMYMWLSANSEHRPWWEIWGRSSCERATGEVRSCPGLDAYSMKRGECSWEEWKITAEGKPCGSTIVDRDLVTVTNVQFNHGPIAKNCNRRCGYGGCYDTTARDFYSKFIIFRSDVGNKYNSNVPCIN